MTDESVTWEQVAMEALGNVRNDRGHSLTREAAVAIVSALMYVGEELKAIREQLPQARLNDAMTGPKNRHE